MRDYRLYLEDILEAIKNIEKYTKGINAKKLKDNSLIRDAVIRNLEIIGEAVKHIPLTLKKKHPLIEWKKISGLRDILAHEYFGVDLGILWDIISNKLPALKKETKAILKKIKNKIS